MKTKPNTIWTIVMDRYGDESKAKSMDGKLYSLIETADIIAEEYHNAKIKPRIEIMSVAYGNALADILRSKHIPHVEVKPLLHRSGAADIYKHKIMQ